MLLVVDEGPAGPRAVHEELVWCGLGRGTALSGGPLDPDAAREALAALRLLADRAHELGAAALRIVATAAVRVASDGEAFRRTAAAAGLPLQVIDGDQEAALAALAVSRALPALARRLLVIDLGGGSTELVLLEADRVCRRRSLPLGAVSVTAQHLAGDPPGRVALAQARQRVGAALSGVLDDFTPRPPAAVGVGGTVTTLAALQLALPRYDPRRVTGLALSRTALAQLAEELAGETVAQRQQRPGLTGPRAQTLLGGLVLVLGLLDQGAFSSLVACDQGLRWGVLHAWLDEESRATVGR